MDMKKAEFVTTHSGGITMTETAKIIQLSDYRKKKSDNVVLLDLYRHYPYWAVRNTEIVLSSYLDWYAEFFG